MHSQLAAGGGGVGFGGSCCHVFRVGRFVQRKLFVKTVTNEVPIFM
jgi:hypothetical protein